MNELHDLLLTKPLTDHALEFMLFASFALHLLFVLLMLGTAMIAVFFFIHSWLTDYKFERRWDKSVLRVHLALKSLAVVLGVAPILIIQVLWGVPFLTAAAILGPYWLSLTGLMIVAFLSLDILGHKMDVHPLRHLIFGVLGLAALVAVPAVFTAVLSLMEHPQAWSGIAQQGFKAEPGLVFHWLMRYLHILGAAAVFGGAFHYFFSSAGNKDRHYHLSHWIFTGTLFQILVGVMLLVSVASRLTPAIIATIATAVFATMLLLGVVFYRQPADNPARMRPALVILPVILVSMLLARQFLQHRQAAPMQAALESKAQSRNVALASFQNDAFQNFTHHLATVYDSGPTIYAQSCAFCHGDRGDGNGPEAGALLVPPEKLNAVRADRAYLYAQLTTGVPGSAMPYFTVFDRDKLQSLLDYMEGEFHTNSPPAAARDPGDPAAAQVIFAQTCVKCHGDNGRVSDFGRQLRPSPPDLALYSLEPDRLFEVITNGYPGTVMQPFAQLPQATRWGLVSKVIQLRHNAKHEDPQ